MSSYRRSPRRRQSSSKQLERNHFLSTVSTITQNEGYDTNQIVPLFQPYTSVDFSGVRPVPRPVTIPTTVWQRVCTHYNVSMNRPYHQTPITPKPVIHGEKSTVFISSKITERLVQNQVIHQRFPTAERLFQYLNCTVRMNKMAQTMMVMKGQNGRNILLIDVELHDQRGLGLYALCSPNDVVSQKAQEWQLIDLLTAPQLINMLGVTFQSLPRGVRAVSPQFTEFRTYSMMDIKALIAKRESRRKPMRYAHLKSVRTGKNSKNPKTPKKEKYSKSEDRTASELQVEFWRFYEAVSQALVDDSVDLIPIVSITSLKGKRGKKFDDFRFDLFCIILNSQNSMV